MGLNHVNRNLNWITKEYMYKKIFLQHKKPKKTILICGKRTLNIKALIIKKHLRDTENIYIFFN